MKQYECDLCGYVYDEAAGDPDNGIAPGTKWEDLPADWVCPPVRRRKGRVHRQVNKRSRIQWMRDLFCLPVRPGGGHPALQDGDPGQDPQQQGAQNEAGRRLADAHGQGR